MKQVIQRFEKKYLLDADQCRSFVMRIQPYITEDIYPASTIYNLYLDTEQFDLIHRSIEKPPFKEKLRIRSYTPVCSEEEPHISGNQTQICTDSLQAQNAAELW